jgi:3,4-dihydroxy 2-butanone 4-phosphate synthase/GTP cyclohydrolase II
MSRLSEALERLKAGGMIIVVDDIDRENEGDLVMAAEHVDAAAIAFMAKEGSGLICLSLEAQAVERLNLAPMVADNRTRRGTAFTVSIEAAVGIDTGISAHDRAMTIAASTAPDATAADLVSPGHVFPLRAAPGGVLVRRGHTEASIDLVTLAGLRPAAVICEIMNPDGAMARGPSLDAFAARHGLPVVSIAELVEHRRAVTEVARANLPTEHGTFEVVAFRTQDAEHLALIAAPRDGAAPLVRVHSECLTGDALGSRRCDCGEQLRASLDRIGQDGGVLVYVGGHEGRGLGLANKIAAYALQDQGLDTVSANHALGFVDDARDYGAAGQILQALGVGRVRLMTNNPRKVEAMTAAGLEVVERVPVLVRQTDDNAAYLTTKRDRLGHDLGHAA